MAKHKKPYKTYYEKILLSFTAILLLPVFNLAWAGLYMVGDAVSGDWGDWGTRLAMTETQEGIFTRIKEARGKQIRTWSDGKHVMIENVDGEYSVTGLNGESHSGVADGSGIVDVEVNCNGVYVVTANCLSKRVLVY